MKLTLYYAPIACSLVPLITLNESGAPFDVHTVLLAKGQQKTPEYLKLNPKGKVPALAIDGDVLTENVAILTYVARSHPQAGLLPPDAIGEARALSAMTYFSNTVHPAFTHFNRPERFTSDEAGIPGVKSKGRENFHALLAEVDGLLTGKQWLAADRFSVADLYAMVFYGWGVRIELPVKELKSYTALKDRVIARPAVRRILEREKNMWLTA